MTKPLKQQRTIGRLEERTHFSFGGAFCMTMIIIGCIWALFSMVAETRGAYWTGWGAFWTGWNVMWGIGALLGQRRHYSIVHFDEPTR